MRVRHSIIRSVINTYEKLPFVLCIITVLIFSQSEFRVWFTACSSEWLATDQADKHARSASPLHCPPL